VKTISVSDELYDLLNRAASRAEKADVSTLLETIAEVVREREALEKDQRQRQMDHILNQVDEIAPGQRALCDRFALAMCALLKLLPDRFSELEGLTKEGGQVVFVSTDLRKIENTAALTNPVRLSNGNWYVNACGGLKDFEIILNLAQKRLGLPVGFVEELKRRTILRPEKQFE